ncbi:MAG: hypothetical protein KH440_02570, partial [Oscillospiraceae bacterium]|nr:hypothetical protein [Oscillospiraceae bacterium]
QNGVSRLHSTRVLQTMSLFIFFSICENYCTLSKIFFETDAPKLKTSNERSTATQHNLVSNLKNAPK